LYLIPEARQNGNHVGFRHALQRLGMIVVISYDHDREAL